MGGIGFIFRAALRLLHKNTLQAVRNDGKWVYALPIKIASTNEAW